MSLISPKALRALLQSGTTPAVRVVDATWFLPNSPFASTTGASARESFAVERIDGAVFVDVDQISDATFSSAGHNLPTPSTFSAAMSEMGIAKDTRVVVYDQHGIFSAPRFWYTLRAYGIEARVLNGGLPGWKSASLPTVGADAPLAEFSAAVIEWRMVDGVQLSLDDMRALQASPGDARVLDARPAGRFYGEAPEPREGLRGGHMPHSQSLPFIDLLTRSETTGVLEMRSDDELREIVTAAGVDLASGGSIVSSCGSGMTAAVLTLALQRVGVEKSAIYDGSWSEWGAQADTPIVKRGADGEDVVVP